MALIRFLYFSLLLLVFLLSDFTFEKWDQKARFTNAPDRRSITFLMGKDDPGEQYFTLAEEHFLFDEKEKTDIIVKACHSLEDMIIYLNEDKGFQKWSTINVVLHGNPYSGLSIPLRSGGESASAKNLMRSMLEDPLPPITTLSLDSLTRINFWACGIGKNPFITIALEGIFELPNKDLPDLYVSPFFVLFKDVPGKEAAVRLNASYWPYLFRRGYRPADHEIAEAMAKSYPELSRDWYASLQDENDPEKMEKDLFHIAVSWVSVYPTKEARPDLSNEKDQLAWIQSQAGLMEKIRETGIPLYKFTWTVYKRIHRDDNGNVVPAVKAIGMASVLCFLKVEES